MGTRYTQSKGILCLDLDLALANGNLVGATHGAAVDALCPRAPAPVLCQFPWEQHCQWTQPEHHMDPLANPTGQGKQVSLQEATQPASLEGTL